MNKRSRHMHSSQRGVASLVVVMVLFFIVSLVAAYASRNLIFEQRTSHNQYRSTAALEAAEAGLEWTLSQLNSGRIGTSCEPTTDTSQTSFRQRYLAINADTGLVTPLPAASSGPAYPTCVLDGANWRCSCPSTGAPGLSAPTGTGIYPAFRVRFVALGVQPGLVRIEANGCTSLNEDCLRFASPTAVAGEGRATVSVLAKLVSGLAAAPSAALTVRGAVNALGTLGLTVANTAPGSGLAIQAGGTASTASMTLQGPAGSPVAGVLQNDSRMPAAADLMFPAVFNMWRDSYWQQPAAVIMDCAAGCSAAAVRAKAALNPGRPLWLQGNLNLDDSVALGSAIGPLLIVVTGSAAVTDASASMFGLLYVQAIDWNLSGAGSVQGAVVAEGNLLGNATTKIAFDAKIVKALATTTGSFVRVPGSWKDF